MNEFLFEIWCLKGVIVVGFVCEISADEKEQRHMYLTNYFEYEGLVNVSDAHSDDTPHDNEEDSDAFNNIKIL